MVSHHYYVDPPRRDKLTEKALLTPFDQGTRFADYGARWGALSAFEKCLFFWAEIHALGLELEPSLGAPWLRLTSEEMFGRDGIGRLLRFLELPERPAMTEAIGDRFDRYSFKTPLQWDVDVVKGHPKVIEVAERLGYDPLEVDPRKIDQRYAMRPRASAPAAPETRDAAKLRQDIPIIGADVEDFGRLRAASKDHSPAFREALDGLRGYCLFVGVPASGLDLVGALLDAHPNIVVAHELDTLKFLGEGFDRLQISWLMAENARRMAAAGRHWGADSLAVPGQWQGRYDKLSLLGDQSGGATSLAASQNPLLIDHLTGVFEERVTFIHVVRNPFDAIATLAVKTGQSLPNCASLYFQLSRANLFIRSRVGDGTFVTVRHEDLLADACGGTRQALRPPRRDRVPRVSGGLCRAHQSGAKAHARAPRLARTGDRRDRGRGQEDRFPRALSFRHLMGRARALVSGGVPRRSPYSLVPRSCASRPRPGSARCRRSVRQWSTTKTRPPRRTDRWR